MRDYQVIKNTGSLYKILSIWVILFLWSILNIPLIDLMIGYNPDDVKYTTDEQLKFVSKRLVYQTYFTTIPSLIIYVYVGIYCFRILKHKIIPPPGNGFPFDIKCVKYRDHYTLGIFEIIISILLFYLGVTGIYNIEALFGKYY